MVDISDDTNVVSRRGEVTRVVRRRKCQSLEPEKTTAPSASAPSAPTFPDNEGACSGFILRFFHATEIQRF